MKTASLAQGNTDQDMHSANGTAKANGENTMSFAVSIGNGTNYDITNAMTVINLPSTDNGSGFNFHLTGPAKYTGNVAATIKYSTDTVDLEKSTQVGYQPDTTSFVIADKVTDWSAIKSILVELPTLPKQSVIGRVNISGTDPTLTTDGGKIGYLGTGLYTTYKPYVNTKSAQIEVAASTRNVTYQFVDDDNNEANVGTKVVAGDVDSTQQTNLKLPDNYVLADGQTLPTSVTIGNTNQTVEIHLKHATKPVTDTKTVTRTINYMDPDTNKMTSKVQTVKLTRTGTLDKVTNKTTWGNWSTSQFDKFDIPTVDGYTASQNSVSAENVNSDTTNTTITITYTANDQTTRIIYQDASGKVIKTDTVSGKTDQTVDTKSSLPAGWKIADSSKVKDIPTHITFSGASTPDTVITVDHIHKTITADNPVADDGKTDSGVLIKGAHKADLNQTITRTINVTDPHQGVLTPVVQTAHISRTADVDEVTGDVTYGAWTTDAANWTEYDAPAVAGYTPSQAKVDAVTVANGQKNVTVNITYTANGGSQTINYVDNSGKVIGTQTIDGKTDQSIAVTPQLPTGWALTNDSGMPTSVTIKPSDTPITVKIEHNIRHVTPDKPVQPNEKTPDGKTTIAGAHESDLNKTLTRTINITDPNGKTTTIKQKAIITREADVDEVTGQVVKYGDWAGASWPEFDDIPPIADYTPSQAKVDKETVDSNSSDQTVNITYTQNEHTTTINYVDQDGKTVGTDKFTSHKGDQKTGQAPEGYHFDGRDDQTITVDNKDSVQQLTVIKNQTNTGDPTTTDNDLANIIYFVDPDGNKVDETTVIGKAGTTKIVTAPEGYHFDGRDDQTVTIDGQKPIQELKVVKNQHDTDQPETPTKPVLNIINYVDEHGKIVKTGTKTGKDGDQIAVQIPAGYHVAGKLPSLVIDSKNPVHTVKIITDEHKVEPTKINNTIEYVDQKGKVIKVDHVSGKLGDPIKLSIPAGYHAVGQLPKLVIVKSGLQLVTIEKDKNKPDKPHNKPAHKPHQHRHSVKPNNADQPNRKPNYVVKPNSSNAAKSAAVNKKAAVATDQEASQQLPQTNDGLHENVLAVLGLALLSLLGFDLKKRRKH